MAKLEICCYSVECALTAEKAGADRIELCAAPSEGGLTPSWGMLKQTIDRLRIPVHPILRPRSGDFCYTASEFAVMKNDIAKIRDLGFPGVVTGILDEDGHVDLPRMKMLCKLSGDMAATFHRAFDMCANPMLALQQLTDLGVSRILTSGQQLSAELGLPLLKELQEASRGPVIMAGAGVRLANIQKFLDIGLQEVHSSASKTKPSTMRYRKVGVAMGSDSEADEFSHTCVDGDTVEAMKGVLDLHSMVVH